MSTQAAVEDPCRPVVIDSDAHVVETEHTWDYLEPAEAKYRPKLFSSPDEPGREYWVIDGRIAGFRFATLSEKELEAQSARTGRLVTSTATEREMGDVGLRLSGMDHLGIDVQILHNSLWIESLTDVPEIEGALCASWNRWMADVQSQGENRLFWTCVVPTMDRERAAEEMRYASEHGAVAVCLRPYERELIVTDPYFYPLFEQASELDLAIAVHIANGSPELTRLLRTRYAPNSGWAQFRVPTVLAAMSVLTSRVTRDFPALRWGMIEASASWVPWICHDICRRSGRPFGPESNPFADHNVFVTCQVDDDIPYVLGCVGEGVLLIGTDFGHTDASSEYDALVKLRSAPEIRESAKLAMLSANPARFYGLAGRVRPASTVDALTAKGGSK